MKPLPSTLKEKDTVCAYCGVSYLIMHEIEKLKAEIAELRKKNALLERKNASSQLEDRDQVARVKAVTDMNAALNSDVARLKVDVIEYQNKNRELEQIVTGLRIKLKDAEILAVKHEDDVAECRRQLARVQNYIRQLPPLNIEQLQTAIDNMH